MKKSIIASALKLKREKKDKTLRNKSLNNFYLMKSSFERTEPHLVHERGAFSLQYICNESPFRCKSGATNL